MHLLTRLLPAFAAWTAVLVEASGNDEKVIERDVVVIGGGSSGTYAAVRLQEEGHTVVVLEKEDHLGGHTVTYTDPDTDLPFNLGVIIYHNSSIVRNYFGNLGVALQNSGAGPEGGVPGYYDFTTGREVDEYQPVSQEALGVAIAKYVSIVLEKYPYVTLGYDLPDPVPEELLAPYSEFIEANDLGDIVQFVNGIAGCNGNLLERPTLYGIRVFSPLLAEAAAAGFVNAASGDNRDLYRAAQSRFEADQSVITQSRIKKIKRSADGVRVWAKTPAGKVLVEAKKLVLAIPPTLENLQHIGLDLTREEKRLVKKFRGFLYGSAVFTHPGVDSSKSFINVGEDTPYNLLTLPGSYTMGTLSAGNVTTDKRFTYFGGLDPKISDRAIKRLIKGELEHLAEEGNIGDGETDFVFLADHSPYHLHVSPKDVKSGFYKELYALEGQTNTFWTGAAFVDNDSTLIWTWTESFLLQKILSSLM